MKKLLVSLLAVSFCLASFASCGGDNNSDNGNSTPDSSSSTPVEETTTDVEGAADYLDSWLIEQDVETRRDFTRPNSLVYPAVGGYTYTITWSVDVAEEIVKLVVNGDETKVDVNENMAENTEFVLTATVSDGNGNEVQVPFYHTLLKAPSVVPQAINEAPVEGEAYKLYMYQVTKKAELYFKGTMSGYYLATTDAGMEEAYKEAVDISIENVEGKEGVFYLTFEDPTNGTKQYIGMTNTKNDKGTHVSATYQPTRTFDHITDEQLAEGTYEWTWNAEIGTVVATIKNATYKNEAGETVTQDGTFYLGTDSTYMTYGPMHVEEADNADACIGYLVKMVDKSSITDDVKVATEKQALNITTSYTGAATAELPVNGSTYGDVAIAWAVKEGDIVAIENNVITVSNPTAPAKAIVTATITLGEVSETIDFEISVNPDTSNLTAAQIVEIAYGLQPGENFGPCTLTGVITVVNSAYSEQYGNVSVTIDVEGTDKTMYCYRIVGAGANEIAPGYTITVTGTITNYNGTIEYAQGATIDSFVYGEPPVVEEPTDAPAADSVITIKEALTYGATFAHNTYSTDKYYVEAKIDNVYNTQYGNMYLIDEEGNKLCIYGTYNADGTVRYDAMEVQPVAGDTVKIYGAIGTYNGTVQFKNAWIVAHTPAAGGETPEQPEPEQPETQAPAADSVLTIPEALAYGATFAHNTYSTDKYYVIATVKKVTNTQYGNMTLIDEAGNELTVYGSYSADGSTRYDAMESKPVDGDTVKVYGVIGTYNTAVQLKNAWIIEFETNEDYVEPELPESFLKGLPVEGAQYYIKALDYENSYIQGVSDNGKYLTVGAEPALTVSVELVAGKTNEFYLKLSNGQYINSASSGNYIAVATTPANSWIINADEMTIQLASDTQYYLQYNANAGQERITRYKNSQQPVWFEVTESSETPVEPETPAEPGEGEATTVTASKTIADLITSEGWTSSTTKQEFALDDVVSVKVNGGSNSGKAYEGTHIRIYATDTPAGTLTITLAEGYELVSIKISTVSAGTDAFLYVDGSSEDIKDTVTLVSGSSVLINSVKNGSNGKQVRVTAIEVVYKAI